MNILFILPQFRAGTKVYAQNVIQSITKNYSDIIIFEKEHIENNSLKEYKLQNENILNLCFEKKIDLVHIEFDYGYFGFEYGNKPFLDLIHKLKDKNISYTISVHNEPEIFLESMCLLNKETSKFKKVISFLKTEDKQHFIVHNPLFLGFCAPLLPANLKDNITFEVSNDFKTKSCINIGLTGFLHKAKCFEDFFKFAKQHKKIFMDQNIKINALFFERVDRQSPDRLEYKEYIKSFEDEHVNIKIIFEDINEYISFIKNCDVGLTTHRSLTQSATITDFIYNGKPVIAREHQNLLYLDFIFLYNKKDTLYKFLSNIRENLCKYNLIAQKQFCEIYSGDYVSLNYRLAFLKNKLGLFEWRFTVGGLCYFKDKLLLFKKYNMPFFDIMHGGIELEESDIITLKREISEELNLSDADFKIEDKLCEFEYIKPLKNQIKVSNLGAKMNVYRVILNKLPNLPTPELEKWSEYSDELIVYENTKELISKIRGI